MEASKQDQSIPRRTAEFRHPWSLAQAAREFAGIGREGHCEKSRKLISEYHVAVDVMWRYLAL